MNPAKVQWDKFETAYGSALDIPKLLEKLQGDTRPKATYKDEPWFSLWSSLCHQGDVYTASYAAVPIIIEIARHSNEEISPNFLLLPACIEVARATGRGPVMPEELSADYKAAISLLNEISKKYEPHSTDLETTIKIAQHVALGEIEQAAQLLNN